MHDFHIYFSCNFCKVLHDSALEHFPTLAIKILIHLRKNRACLFLQAKVFLCEVRIFKAKRGVFATQPAITCSKLTIEILKQAVKCVQS